MRGASIERAGVALVILLSVAAAVLSHLNPRTHPATTYVLLLPAGLVVVFSVSWWLEERDGDGETA